jgi:hypothetical protein
VFFGRSCVSSHGYILERRAEFDRKFDKNRAAVYVARGYTSEVRKKMQSSALSLGS